MKLSDKDLEKYVTDKLALPGDDRNKHRKQVGRLLETLEAKLHEDGSYRIKKFRRAGSLEKGTSNRPRAGKPVNADIGVYFDVNDPESFDLAHLLQLIKQLLEAAYPQKSTEDFDDSGGRIVEVVFRESGLKVNLVPIVSLDADANYGYQYSRAGDRVKTSVKVHIDHYRDHAARDPFLAPTLRIAKRWRNWQTTASSPFTSSCCSATWSTATAPRPPSKRASAASSSSSSGTSPPGSPSTAPTPAASLSRW